MDKIIQEVSQSFKTLPLSDRVLIQCVAFVIALNGALEFGESAGRALYHFTH